MNKAIDAETDDIRRESRYGNLVRYYTSTSLGMTLRFRSAKGGRNDIHPWEGGCFIGELGINKNGRLFRAGRS